MTEHPLEKYTDDELATELRNRCDVMSLAMHRHDRSTSGASVFRAHGTTLEAIGLAAVALFDLLIRPEMGESSARNSDH